MSAFSYNAFSELSSVLPASLMQWFVVLMIGLVVFGVLFDVWHKRSATYFFAASRKSAERGSRAVGGGEKMSIAVKTAASEVLTSSEFCNPQRRVAHLLGMYGFVIYLVSTIVLVFNYAGADAATPALWPILWHLGALMVCVGGYWFWFFIRVDVASEGNSVFRLVRADLFIVSLLASCTLALVWSFVQSSAGLGFWSGLFLVLYIIATLVLFCGIPWSKFAHMFFKPAAAFQKKVAVANGDMDNLPRPADRTNAEDSDRHSMSLLKDAPLDMGLGIKREQPHHY